MLFYFPYTLLSSSHPHNAVRNDKVQAEPTAWPRRQLPAHKRKQLLFEPSLDTRQRNETLQWQRMSARTCHIKTGVYTLCSALGFGPTAQSHPVGWIIDVATHSWTRGACLLCAAYLRGKSGRRQAKLYHRTQHVRKFKKKVPSYKFWSCY